ncbi:MAG: alpha/beta hydrolase, partial [bacterium]
RPLVLFCHGNAGNISHRLETAEYLVGLGAAVVLFDYAGYGRSEGRPSEENTYADALAAYQWVLRETGFEADRVVIMGRSLGGAVAIDLAARVAARGLIVESAFTSALDMGRRMFPFVPVAWLLRHHFDALSKIGVVNCPVLIVHSVDDEMIPYEMGQQLFQSARPPKQMVTISGSHNNREYFDNEEYRAAVGQVLKGATPSQREP